MNAHLETSECPLVVHLIPSTLGRGAQHAARILVDRLDEPGVIRHKLLSLFAGPLEVEADLTLGHAAPGHTAEGFDLRVARALRTELGRLKPAAVVAHGGDPMKYAVPATIGTGRPLVYCVIGTYAGPRSPWREWVWRRTMSRADLVVAVGEEVREECTTRFGVAPHRAIVIANGRDPALFHPRPVVGGDAHHTHFRGCSDVTKAARSFRGGSTSPACRRSFVPCRAGRRRAALPTPCRHGGRARGRASRFSLRRSRNSSANLMCWSLPAAPPVRACRECSSRPA